MKREIAGKHRITFEAGTVEINDDTPLKLYGLATYMRISTGTMAEYRKAGYRMEFGIRTTAGHFKAWLQDHAAKHRETEKFDIQAALSRFK